ncbi:uncharacterized protein LOC101864487 [Aplysia californica]|uniref:Uncharacterized protein LOC101864487 n=1 Tax=Aplysia californica TaxID=6500 RepID=A0ABM0K742_APLCA|nr:uncharacterized protein LOC101864487 [Aplysia californica]
MSTMMAPFGFSVLAFAIYVCSSGRIDAANEHILKDLKPPAQIAKDFLANYKAKTALHTSELPARYKNILLESDDSASAFTGTGTGGNLGTGQHDTNAVESQQTNENINLNGCSSRMCHNLRYLRKYKELDEKIAEKFEVGGDQNVFSLVWHLYKFGQPKGGKNPWQNSLHLDVHLPVGTSMSSIRGAVLVLGSCGQALAVGLKAEGNTVVLLMFDADDAFRCEQRLREEKLTNVFVAVPGPGEFLESAVSLVLSQSAVNYNACLLNGLSELTEGLLPHEVEESMAKLLTVSRRLIVHFDVSNDRVEFFKAAWENPKGLLQKVCALSGVRLCSFNLSSGVGLDWNDSTFVVGGQECVNGSSKSLPCPGPDGSVPFNSLLNYNLTAESKLSLFSSLLGATVSIDDPALLMVKGGEIKRSSQSANRQSKFISEDFVQKPLRHDSRLKQSGIPLTSKSEAPHVDKGGQVSAGNDQPAYGQSLGKKEIAALVGKLIDQHKINSMEDQWNREEPASVDVSKTLLSRLQLVPEAGPAQPESRRSFDIIDGRPLEEQKSLTKAYSDLGERSVVKNVLKNPQEGEIYPKVSKKFVNGGTLSSNEPPRATGSAESSQDIRKLLKKRAKKNDNGRVEKIQPDIVIHNNEKPDAIINKDMKPVLMKPQLKKEADNSKAGMRKLLDFDPLHIAQPFDIAKQFKWKFSGESPAVGDGQDSVPLWKRSRNHFLSLDSTPQPTVLPSSTGSSNNTEKKYKEKLFQALWSMVRPLITRKLKRGADLAAFVSGQCYMSMLSTKLSLLNPSASVLALDADRRSKCHKKYSGLLESSGAKNNFLVRKVLDPDITFDMSHRPQVFDVQVIGPEVFSWLLHLGTEFPEFLGRILTLSRVTVIEVPSWDTGRKSLSLFPIDGLELMNDFKTLVDLSLSSVGAGAVSKVKELTNSQWKVLKETRVFAVHLESFSRNVYMSCVNSQSSLTRLDIWPSSITYRSGSETKSLSVRGLCLQILLSLDSEKSFRTRLFQSYLRVKLHPDMCPAQLHWRDGALRHLSDTDTDSESETLTMLIKKEIHEKRYSFMDYNSNNSSVGRSLAVGSPNSTFLLARPTHLQASHLSDVLNADGLTNCLSLRLPVTASYTNNIMKSPDIFRYQYFDFLQLLFATGSTAGSVAGYEDDVEFQVKVGEILASSVTSFITLPSPEILSLAATTFFPGTFLDNPELISDNVPAFQLADKVLLMQTPRADVDIKVHSSFLRHQKVPGSTGARFPWSVGVVRVMDLKLEVDHHFNFELDHHARKYTQFCHRDNVRSQPHVYLRRHEDDYKINYGNVNAISLIALLRMGLLPADKAKFYNSFVELPLYEDMAPWNIVYRGGHLEYIDQDTKDKTFDKLVPLAYQVMLVLVNYRRTVEDFRHCGDSASMLVDIPGIASCVRSQFGGPCNDSRYPVPCGDKSCRSTYIECLQVMQRKVKNKDTAKSVEQSSHVRKASSEVWGFGNNGMKD